MSLDPEALRLRATLLRAVRSWFDAHGYLEVPTPVMVPSPALEASLVAFAVSSGPQFLRTSPELALKRVLAAGLPRIVELGPCFRDEEHGDWHRGEFWMCEWYRAGASLPDLMAEVRSLIDAVAHALGVVGPQAWTRHQVRTLFADVTGLDLHTASAADLSSHGEDWDTAFFRRWVEQIEPTLTEPCFVEAWPASQAALATVRTDSEWAYAERFEVFMGGVELANAFQELADPHELRRRWAESDHPVDELFLAQVAKMPRTAGIALGLDRLLAVLMGWSEIGPGRVERN
ncbi:MAG: amino acid--tRNA ligase-related protein [Myxococcota bacterium]